MMYERIFSRVGTVLRRGGVRCFSSKPNHRVIDVRSDTVTKPTQEMRAVMAAAEVGDDVYGEDPAINALEEKSSKLLSKEDALFVPTGTMGNLLSVMAHSRGFGENILVGDNAHQHHCEQGGIAQFGSIYTTQVRNLTNGTLDLEDLKSKITTDEDPHFCHTRLICLEQTHNFAGGRVLPVEYIDKVGEIAKKHNIGLHIDGARFFNAVTALNEDPARVAKAADSVTFCLSKGLGAPVGSVIVGKKDFIWRCKRARKAIGGGMRQAGVLAAVGSYCLDHIRPKLQADHDRTKRLAEGLQSLKEFGIEIDPSHVETNILIFGFKNPRMSADELVHRLGEEHKGVTIKMGTILGTYPYPGCHPRAVLHHQISDEDVDIVLDRTENILRNI